MAWSSIWGLVALPPLLLLLALVVRTLDWAWWRPRRLERELRAQGIKGSRFRFPYGDLKLNGRLRMEACAKPLPLTHAIAPRIAPFHHRAMHEYGKVSLTWHGPVPRVTILEPELVKEVIFTRYDDFGKTNENPLGELFLKGVVQLDGEKWVKHRKILNPAFHAEKLKKMVSVFSVCVGELMSRWEKMVGSEGRYEMDVFPDIQDLAGNVISRAAFGGSSEDGKRIYHLLTEQEKLLVQSPHTVLLPGYTNLPTPTNRKMKALDREIKGIVGKLIKEREEDMKAGKASNNDLLGLLMESNMSYSREPGNENTKLTAEEVIDECKLFFFAGQETTSDLITWTMFLLSMNPSWQVRAREEVLKAFGKNKIPSYDGLNHLKIVPMIQNEVLRLYPSAPMLHRQTNKTVKLGNVVYPPGVLLAIPTILLHHDPDTWGKDVDEFNPERFADGVAKASIQKNAFVPFIPFGFGPRICIGQNFALIEARLAICMILQRFSFELSSSYTHAPQLIFTLQPQYGVQLKMRRI